MNDSPAWILTAQCPSNLGTVDVVTSFLAQKKHYVTELSSYDDRLLQRFCLRVQFRPEQESFDAEAFHKEFTPKAQPFAMQWELTPPNYKTRVAILVSKYDHCLNDLLYRYRAGSLNIEIPVIISNHPDLKMLAKWHNIPYYHLPVNPKNKKSQEKKIWQLINQNHCELVVLARYMQVLSEDLCEKLAGKAINIHHSLLPGFKGAKPYHQAWEKGVKLVGATAHYVNTDLDEGPIITQKVQTVNHSLYPEQLIAKGKHIESQTLAEAIGYHIDKRVFLFGHRTIILAD